MVMMSMRGHWIMCVDEQEKAEFIDALIHHMFDWPEDQFQEAMENALGSNWLNELIQRGRAIRTGD